MHSKLVIGVRKIAVFYSGLNMSKTIEHIKKSIQVFLTKISLHHLRMNLICHVSRVLILLKSALYILTLWYLMLQVSWGIVKWIVYVAVMIVDMDGLVGVEVRF